jgi:two-component system chemotaxis response regulator CheB
MELLSQLPATFPVPIVIVQHMPPMFTQHLANRLSSLSKIGVREGTQGEFLKGGCAWIAPGGYHMDLVREVVAIQIHIHQNPPENSCRPAVDVLFRSVAKIYGRRTLAVVLTGMGQDGLRGCKCIREEGGQILIQDELSSVVWGMPGAVSKAGLADGMLPLNQLGAEIIRRTQFGRIPPTKPLAAPQRKYGA